MSTLTERTPLKESCLKEKNQNTVLQLKFMHTEPLQSECSICGSWQEACASSA